MRQRHDDNTNQIIKRADGLARELGEITSGCTNTQLTSVHHVLRNTRELDTFLEHISPNHQHRNIQIRDNDSSLGGLSEIRDVAVKLGSSWNERNLMWQVIVAMHKRATYGVAKLSIILNNNCIVTMRNTTGEAHYSNDNPWHHIVVVLQMNSEEPIKDTSIALIMSAIAHKQRLEQQHRELRNTLRVTASILGGTALVLAITFGLSML
jgi:hypothetical protein